MFRPPTAKSEAPKKKPVKKDTPIPIIVPESLFVAIRSSCIVLALDENPHNRLNEHKDPIVRTYSKGSRQLRFVCYTPELIKCWLRVLLTAQAWRDVVEVPKTVKTKFGTSTLSSVDSVNVSIMRLPSDVEIAACVDNNAEMIVAHKLSRDVIRDILLGPNDLVLSDKIALGVVPDPSAIASPSNICKVSRLEMLKMNRAVLTSAEKKSWEQFHSTEKARMSYVSNMLKSTRVSDSILHKLTDSEAVEYNNQMLQIASESVVLPLPSASSFEDTISVRNKGTIVNPALVHLYDTSRKAQGAKTDKESIAELYKAMCKKYYTLTGHKLDLAEEKKEERYDLRIGDITWAEELRASNPVYSFLHYAPTDRIRAVQGVMSEEATLPVPKASQAPQAVGRKQIEAPKQLRSSKMFSTVQGNRSFTSASMYSTFKPVVKKIDGSAIQQHMARTHDAQEEDEYYGDEPDHDKDAQAFPPQVSGSSFPSYDDNDDGDDYYG